MYVIPNGDRVILRRQDWLRCYTLENRGNSHCLVNGLVKFCFMLLLALRLYCHMLIFEGLGTARKFPTEGYCADGQMCENAMMHLSTSKKYIYIWKLHSICCNF